jgi:hypothetical protein
MLDEGVMCFVGIGADHFLAEFLVQCLDSLPVVLPQECEEPIGVLRPSDVLCPASHGLEARKTYGAITAVTGQDELVFRNHQRLFEAVLLDGFGQLDNLGIGSVDATIKVFVLGCGLDIRQLESPN